MKKILEQKNDVKRKKKENNRRNESKIRETKERRKRREESLERKGIMENFVQIEEKKKVEL